MSPHTPYAKLAADCLPRRDGSLPSGVRTQLSLAHEHVAARCVHLGLDPSRVGDMIAQAEKTCHHLVDLCESPIESMMLPWLIVEDYGPLLHTFPARGFHHKKDDAPPAGDLIVSPQFAIVRYRADFAITARLGQQTKTVLVECDGQEFHAAAPDRRRDACLRAYGFETVRASRAEILACPRNVSAQVSSILQEWAAQ